MGWQQSTHPESSQLNASCAPAPNSSADRDYPVCGRLKKSGHLHSRICRARYEIQSAAEGQKRGVREISRYSWSRNGVWNSRHEDRCEESRGCYWRACGVVALEGWAYMLMRFSEGAWRAGEIPNKSEISCSVGVHSCAAHNERRAFTILTLKHELAIVAWQIRECCPIAAD